MIKTHILFAISLVTIFVIFQGCATDSILLKNSLSSASKIEVGHHTTANMQVRTIGDALLIPIAGVVFKIPQLGEAAAQQFGENRGEKTQKYLPDYGLLVMNKFIDRANNEIKHLPPMVIRDQPVEDNSAESNVKLEITINKIIYTFLVGVLTDSSITMRNSKGAVLWERSFTYKSSDFNRVKSFDQLKANNNNLLNEEFIFAADKTVNDFMDHFKQVGVE